MRTLAHEILEFALLEQVTNDSLTLQPMQTVCGKKLPGSLCELKLYIDVSCKLYRNRVA